MVIKWEEPAPQKRGRGVGRWVQILEELRDHPGEWALIAEGANTSVAYQIAHGRLGGARSGEFEAVSRSAGNGRNSTSIYARYVGK